MATYDDPRSSGKVVRTQGKNISKLMRFFDSGDRTMFDDADVCPRHAKLDAKSNFGASQNQQLNDTLSSTIEKSVTAESNNFSVRNSQSPNDTNVSTSKVTKDSERMSSSEISPSKIPYCRKVASNGLWENVNIGVQNDNIGLWNATQNQTEEVSNSLLASAAELHNLIAVSRAELSKKREPTVSDKSNLENYFTSFENSKPSSTDCTNYSRNPSEYSPSPYDCDINEMNFEDEEAMLSDTSSEEDLRCHPSTANTNYLPAYALHTIIEESCEESERESRTATPTNNVSTSKLERYFSWDIINDTEADLRKKADDESTIYSDSLSESSGSLVGDDAKEIDPSQLASSRLEKYFTSGLVDDQNYFYPDDAEFLDDTPVSDFEEDSIHQKISRSALLSSLETKPSSDSVEKAHSELNSSAAVESGRGSPLLSVENAVNSNAKLDCVCDNTEVFSETISHSENNQSLERCVKNPEYSQNDESFSITENAKFVDDALTSDILESTSALVAGKPVDIEVPEKIHSINSTLHDQLEENNDPCLQRPLVNKDQIANDIQAIIKKLLSYFTDTGSESLKENIERDYISAWQILETEIERLLQSISPTGMENNSCSSSTIDSNNSDYGSDTIESMDCMTDEDDNLDSKNRISSKCPLVDIFNSAYKIPTESDLSNINISEETLSIWKRLIQSLQKDNSLLSENKVCDPTAEARLYIRDQIVTLMHTVTVNDPPMEVKKSDVFHDRSRDVSHSLIEEDENSEQINEAYNMSLGHSDVLSLFSGDAILSNNIPASKTESSSDEGISEDGTENSKSSLEISIVTRCSSSNKSQTESENSVDCSMDKNTTTALCELITNTENPSNSTCDLLESQSLESSASKHEPKNKPFTNKGTLNKDNDLKFSVFVDINLGDESSTIMEHKSSEHCPENEQDTAEVNNASLIQQNELKSSPQLENNKISSPPRNSVDGLINESHIPTEPSYSNKSCDTGYYSFKSSDDSLLNITSGSAEHVEVPNFKSLKRSIKKFPVSNTLSKSTNNILQTFSQSPDAMFSTLQLKPKKSKVSSNPSGTSKQFSSLFSPAAVLKRFTGSKSGETSNPESSIPPKYLKKYARSVSVDNESLFGAASMPHLNSLKPGDSYSALGLYSENDRGSSLMLDDDTGDRRYFSGSQSVLSLGAHSASMTSVYSSAGCHYGYVTVSGDVLFGLNYNQKSQVMEVFVKQCRNLAAIDLRHNKSNPYVKVYLLPDKTRSGKRKTKTKKNTLNPIFNELLRFPVLKNELESRTLWLSVWNSDLFGRNDFLGEISLPLGYRLLDSPTLRWYPLQERVESLTSPLNYKGELFIALKYVPRDLSLESRFRPAPVISLRGALHVLVKEARNISGNRSGGTLDAFCKSYLLPDKSKSSKQKTPIVKKSAHPKWYYTVIYEDLSVDELRERSLELTVWDHDKITSNEFMGGLRLNTSSGLYHGVPVDWMDSRRDESALWQSMLASPNMWVDGCLPLRPTMQFHHS